MSETSLQTVAALIVTMLAIGYLAWRWQRSRNKSGCGGGECACPKPTPKRTLGMSSR